jgi:hypothetical protein
MKAYFHRIKGRETLSRSHKDLNPADNNARLTESVISTELWNLKVLFSKLLLIKKKNQLVFFDCAWSKPHVVNLQIRWTCCTAFLLDSVLY